MGKSTARFKQRCSAAYDVQQGKLGNEVLSQKEADALFVAIEKKRAAEFGIMKLAHVDLNRHYMYQERSTTLLREAILQERFKIAIQLMFCGADPTDRGDGQSCLSSPLRRFLSRMSPQIRIWYVAKVFAWRVQPVLPGDTCYLCGKCSPADALKRECGCCACEACFWELLPSSPTGHHCGCDAVGGLGGEGGALPGGGAEASRERFDRLPPLFNPKTMKRPKSRFTPLSPEEAASVDVGLSQEGRTTRFHQGCVDGSVARVRAVVEAGVSIDAANEYGQTGLFLAAYHGRVAVVRLLLGCGASGDHVANGGTTPCIAAAANGHAEVVNVLADHGADLDTPGPGGHPALHFATVGGHSSVVDALRARGCELAGEVPAVSCVDLDKARVTTLIPQDADHEGAGAFMIDGAFTDEFLDRMDALFVSLPRSMDTRDPEAEAAKGCALRTYCCDSEGWVTAAISEALLAFPEDERTCSRPLAHARFLHYPKTGGHMPPHVDLAKKDPISHVSSTHTFLLHLRTCEGGGETALLPRVAQTVADCGPVMASVRPVRGRLLGFPHQCPHAGVVVVDAPKICLRGELLSVHSDE